MSSPHYRIKEVADRSGFTAATLRYYEELGLLPQPARTPAGYRSYDDRALERLAFIARAKQLGCTLDEIADLMVAWEGGSCGPVQRRLRSLVADKLSETQSQIVQLTTFSAELHRAAAVLERHRPEGPCDATCGCVGHPPGGERAETAPVGGPPAPTAPTIACTLSAGQLRGRVEDWQALLTHATRRTEIAGGLRIEFAPGAPAVELMRLVEAEQDCCQFFRFAIVVDARGLALEVTAPEGAEPVVASLFGGASFGRSGIGAPR